MLLALIVNINYTTKNRLKRNSTNYNRTIEIFIKDGFFIETLTFFISEFMAFLIKTKTTTFKLYNLLIELANHSQHRLSGQSLAILLAEHSAGLTLEK